MIRIAAVAALLFSTAAQARHYRPPPPPPPPDAPAPPLPPEPPEIDIVLPHLPELPELPDIDIDLDLGGLPRLLALADRGDEDQDEDAAPQKDEKGVKVYRMNQMPRLPSMPRLRIEQDDDFDRDAATARANGRGSATLPVKGPVTFQLHAQAGDVDVVTTDRQQVTVTVSDAPDDEVALYAFGDRVVPAFKGRRQLRHGKLHVELPKGSRLDLSSMSGDVTAQRLGEVRIRTLSVDVKIAGVNKADVQSISGDVRIEGAAGPVRLHTVSGTSQVATTGTAPQVDFQSASGSLDWSGACAKDCHLNAETVSGELRMAVDPKSSFELSYTSHSGELRDEVNLTVKRAPSRKHGFASGFMEATYGSGEGVIEADAFSGNLVVKKK